VAAAGIYFLNMAVGAVCLGWNTGTVNTENFWYYADYCSVLDLILRTVDLGSIVTVVSLLTLWVTYTLVSALVLRA